MKTDHNLSGEWTGTITYGSSYGEHSGKHLQFKMNLKQTGSDLSGTASDIAGFGVSSDQATILGKCMDNRVDFIKQYASFHYGSPKDEKVTVVNRPGPKIKYTGILNADGSVNGEWRMKSWFLLFWIIPFLSKNSGTWSMKRI